MKSKMRRLNVKDLSLCRLGMGVGFFLFLCLTPVPTWALEYEGPGIFTIDTAITEHVIIRYMAEVTMVSGGSVVLPTPEPLPERGTDAIEVEGLLTWAQFIMEDGVLLGSGGTDFEGHGLSLRTAEIAPAIVGIKGGSIQGSSGPGQARGGDGIFCWFDGGQLNISGGTINGGDNVDGFFAGSGITVYNSTLTISNGSIKGGDKLSQAISGNAGTGISVNGGNTTIAGGSILGGTGYDEGSEAILVSYSDAQMSISGGEMRGGNGTNPSNGRGGPALFWDWLPGGNLTITGGNFWGGNGAKWGGNALDLKDRVFTNISGGEFHPGSGSDGAGAALSNEGMTTINGGNFFGQLYLSSYSQVTINSGHFTDTVNGEDYSDCEINGGLFEGVEGAPGVLRGTGSAAFYVNGPDLTFDWTTLSLSGTLNDGTSINVVVELFQNAALFINGVDKTPRPDIELDSYSLNFGNVAWQDSSVLMFTVSNVGTKDLIVSNISLQASDDVFSLLGPSSFTVSPGASQDVEVSFTAQDFGVFNNAVSIWSNDRDERIITVSLTGTGVVASTPSEQVSDINEYIDSSITEGSLSGTGSGSSSPNRVEALKNMITAAGDLIAQGKINKACEQLDAAYEKCDGQPNPPDMVTGQDAETIAWMIDQLKAEAGCQ